MTNRANVGFVGGLVRDADGQQMAWNYGPRMAAPNDVKGMVYLGLEALRQRSPQLAARGRRLTGKLLQQYPDPSRLPQERSAFWVSEANMAIEADKFRALGGFDEKLREHEIQDLAIRAHNAGLKGRFYPAVAVTHHAVDVRDYDRNRAMLQAEWYIARRHGLRNWLLPPRP